MGSHNLKGKKNVCFLYTAKAICLMDLGRIIVICHSSLEVKCHSHAVHV